MHTEEEFRELIEGEFSKLNLDGRPARLYDPIRYMIGLGGKRLRPALMLMSHELFGGNATELIRPAMGIEVFHNFTLLHDDIMDKAPLRRAQETVHRKWNSDIAILSGDAMFVQSCMLMMNVRKEYLQNVLSLFFKSALEVCEGQQTDMDFEIEENVTIDDYIQMISQKTAALIGCSTAIGVLCAGAEKKDVDHMYSFGKNLGIAFQLHDDILDVYGDADKFGKQIGGDILANKKTILLLTAFELAKGKSKVELEKWLGEDEFNPDEKISAFISIYDYLGVKEKASKRMDEYFHHALSDLNSINSRGNKEHLINLSERLMVREK